METGRRGLEINQERTKYTTLSRNNRGYTKERIEIRKFRVMNRFKYFGVILNNSNDERGKLFREYKHNIRPSSGINSLRKSKRTRK